jgi:dTDP-glucose 4,6-dehydratase
LKRDYSIVNYDKLTYAGNLANLESIANDPAYSFFKGDICDAAAVESVMAGCDSLVHFAAESHVDRSIYEPELAVKTNITGTLVLLQAARKAKVKRFVHISTDEVYGDIEPGAFADESSPLRPNSPYSASKASSDLLVHSYVRTFGFPALIVRPSNNYGPYQFPEKFLPLMISNALEDRPLPIYGDGAQQRTWLHVKDNCNGILAVLERGRVGEIYNIGGSDVVDNLTMARHILRATGKTETLITHVQDRPGHDRRYAVSSKKIGVELGWNPITSLDEGFRQTIEWYRNNKKWLADVQGGDYRLYYQKNYENRDSYLKSIANPGQNSQQ